MKILHIFIALLCSCSAFSQTKFDWKVVDTKTTENINDMYWHTPNVGYIVGDNYLFKKTTDGGQTWKDLTPPTTGEKPGNNGNIVGIDYHPGFSFSHIDSGLFITWQKGFHGSITPDEGQSYSKFLYSDSTMFCNISGFTALEENKGNGYVNLITYGESCSGNGVFQNFYNGPFSFNHDETFTNPQKAHKITDVDKDSSLTIFANSDGYLRSKQWVTGAYDSTLLDTHGVTSVAALNGGAWYAATKRGFYQLYKSVDSGKTFSVDSTYEPTFYYPIIEDMEFLNQNCGIMVGSSNIRNGVIIIKDSSNSWFHKLADKPLNKAKLFENGVGYVIGEGGLMMRTGALPAKDTSKGDTTVIKGVNFLQFESEFVIFPNPTDGKVNIKILTKDLGVLPAVSVYNTSGQKLREYDNMVDKIDLSSFPKGEYIIDFRMYDKTVQKRIIKY